MERLLRERPCFAGSIELLDSDTHQVGFLWRAHNIPTRCRPQHLQYEYFMNDLWLATNSPFDTPFR